MSQLLLSQRKGKTAEASFPQRSLTDSIGNGRPLDRERRVVMEPIFGRDFGDVRIHDDSKSADAARSVGAAAYTIGRDIFFGKSQYSPGSDEGMRLLAHELMHVLQQSTETSSGDSRYRLSMPEDPAEVEADRIASGIPYGGREVHSNSPIISISRTAGVGVVSRQQQQQQVTQLEPNPFIPSPTVPDLPDSVVKAVTADIKARSFQLAINKILSELAISSTSQPGVGPAAFDLNLLENHTMRFDPSLNQEGATANPTKDRQGHILPQKVTIGPPAFNRDVPWLYSTMLHEFVHVLQNKKSELGQMPANPRLGNVTQIGGTSLDPRMEVEAYAKEILNARNTGMAASIPNVEEIWGRLLHHQALLFPIAGKSLQPLVDQAFQEAERICGQGKLAPPRRF